MGSGSKKRVELARLEAELETVRKEQTAIRVREDPQWKLVAWAFLVWSVLGPIVGFVVGMYLF